MRVLLVVPVIVTGVHICVLGDGPILDLAAPQTQNPDADGQ